MDRSTRQRVIFCALGSLLLFLGCKSRHPVNPEYQREIEQWRSGRVERLRAPEGWLSLAGLYWLKPGENRFGSDPKLPVALPTGTAPPNAGAFFLENNRVRVKAEPGVELKLGSERVAERELKDDAQGAPDVLALGRLRLQVIVRGGGYAIRVKDPERPERKTFRGIDYYPIDEKYRLRARFVPYEPKHQIELTSAQGPAQTMEVPGYVEFELAGNKLRLEPALEEKDAKEFFFIFRDATSNQETYGAGRYLYSELPKSGELTIDFNKAYNPPCAFTHFATCPLPPKQNRLDVRIEAGEKKPSEH